MKLTPAIDTPGKTLHEHHRIYSTGFTLLIWKDIQEWKFSDFTGDSARSCLGRGSLFPFPPHFPSCLWQGDKTFGFAIVIFQESPERGLCVTTTETPLFVGNSSQESASFLKKNKCCYWSVFNSLSKEHFWQSQEEEHSFTFTPNTGLELCSSSQTPLSFDKISGELQKHNTEGAKR